MAGQKGIVIQITADPESAKRALEMVRQELRETGTEADRSAQFAGRFASGMEAGVPKMAAASAGLRALEGNFTNNIRAGERFLSMLPGMSNLLQTAFPAVGAIVLGTALVEMGKKAYDAFQNIVMLKGAIEQLNQMDINVAKKVVSAADAQEASLESTINATLGRAASLKQKYSYENGKGIDLSDFFYDKNISGLQTNVKANYESLYKNIAPQDVPQRLAHIRSEMMNLSKAMRDIQSGNMSSQVPFFGGYGPGMTQDPYEYYAARLKLATQIQDELEAERGKRAASLNAIQAEIAAAGKKEGEKDSREQSPIERARAEYQEEEAKRELSAQKAFNQVRLAELEAQHKMELVSDQEFYQEKLQRQLEELDKEESALNARQAVLQELYAKQRADKFVPRDSAGHSAAEYKTLKDMAAVQSQRDDLNGRRGQLTSETTAEQNAANLALESAGLRLAAELERERNSGIEAQIALLQREAQIKASTAELNNDPAQAATIRALEQQEENKLRIGEVTRQIAQVEEDYRLKVEQVNAAEQNGVLTKRQAQQQIYKNNKQEAQDLQKLIAMYDELAAKMGGDYVQQGKKLHAQVTKLNTPDDRDKAAFAQTLSSGVQSMAENIARDAARGKQSFHDMVKSMEADAVELVMKLLFLKLGSMGGGGGFWGSLFGGSAAGTSSSGAIGMPDSVPFFAAGGDYSGGPMIVGENGPELLNPKGPGQITSNALLSKMAQSSGGSGKAPNITTNVINQSSQPVTAQTSTVSYDAEGHTFVKHVILTDLAQGGMISQALRGPR